MATKLFVGGLSWDTTEDSLRNFFSQHGTVVSAIIITDKFSGKSKGFGFVEMGSETEAKEAMEKLNGQDLDGRRIAINEARPQAPRDDRFPRPSRPFGGGGGGGGGGGRDFHRRDNRGPRGHRPSSYR